MSREVDMSTDRRSFLTHLGAGVTVAGTALASGVSVANAQSSSSKFTPARHPLDDWMDKLPGKHRMVFDTTSPAGIGVALAYANNFLNASKEYGLKDQDHAVIIIARHFATTFAYNDAMWAKYGKSMPPMVVIDDPKTKARPTINLYAASGYQDLPNMGTTIPEVLQKGVHFAVCNLATTFFAGMLAQATGAKQDDVYKELTANLIGNSTLVPAGIVAVNRAQEHGFTLTTAV
jgi:intracellular sulfur oxidation DsrE/DsrF family protein